MLVELGGGTRPHPRADVIIDLHHPRRSPPQDASVTPWTIHYDPRTGKPDELGVAHGPINDGKVEEVYASHFMEHVPKHDDKFIHVMNEAWRILRPGGTFTIIVPLVGYTDHRTGEPQSKHIGWQPWADPTHVHMWWLPEALMYFCAGPFKPNADYGIHEWAPLGEWMPPHLCEDIEILNGTGPVDGRGSFWSVRNTWEGIARLVKP